VRSLRGRFGSLASLSAAVTCSVLACAFAAALAGRAEAAPPAGFEETTVFSGLDFPTAVSFSPDGRVFVAEKSGVIKVFDDLDDETPTQFADLSTDVHNYWDRGLLGMALDPSFPSDPYVYVTYTRDALPGGNSPRWGTPGVRNDGCPTPPGPTDDGCVVTGRVARLTAAGNVATAVTPLITDWCQQYPSHSIGDLGFGADGNLYVSGGDGASFNFTDWGQDGNPLNPCGDPPGGPGSALTPPTAEGGALRSQDPRTPGDPTSLDGAVLRVNPDTGAGVSGNPFFSSSDPNLRRIIATGQRNPFKLAIRPGTNEVWTGETGWGTWEEVNRLADPGGTAENFGWPCYEGNERQIGYDQANLNLCENLYQSGTGAVTQAAFAWNHNAQVIPGESCQPGGSAVGGVEFYEGGGFPDSYSGALFFADYSRDCMWVLKPNAAGVPANVQAFNPGALHPVDIEFHDGEIFWVNFNDGLVKRISYPQGNSAPNAVLTATPSSGPAPLTVTLDASGSSDPDGSFGALSFAWDLNGDGTFESQGGASRTTTYPAGTHTPRVRVTDPDGASDTDSVQVQSNNTPPQASIDAPAESLTWAVGDVIGLSGSATDTQQGSLPDSAFDWDVIVDHCPSNCHQHVIEQLDDRKSGFFVAPDHEYPSTLTIRLIVTDQGGLTDTESVTIAPKTVTLSLDSVPGGLELALNSEVGSAPFTRPVIQGSQNTISASSPQTVGGEIHDFASWSDGGAATHTLTADQSTALVATFHDRTPPPAPQLLSTDPVSPSNRNSLRVIGTVPGDATAVDLYTNAVCGGAPASTGTPSDLAQGIWVGVPSDKVTQISARSRKPAGQASPCSNVLLYTEDSTGPATFLRKAPRRVGPVPKRRHRKAKISFLAGEPARGFRCRLDRAAWRPCLSPVGIPRLRPGRHRFLVRAIDFAGNPDRSPAVHRFRVVKKKGWPAR
jgi:glucose/arabinose dehydrogenase